MHADRVVVVMGGAGGIGSKIVDRFVRNGDRVIVIDRDVIALERLQGTRNAGRLLTMLEGDVSIESEAIRLAEEIRSSIGRVDVQVNCAGYYPVVSFDEMTFADWQEVVGINLSAAFLMTHALFPLLKGRGWGRVVNIGFASVF